jgi:hypothetical protein
MRKILLASAAILGASTGAWAAETGFSVAPSQGMTAMPWASGPAANNNNNAVGTAVPGANAVPTPGTVVIRLNGRVETDIAAAFGSGDRATSGGVNFKTNPMGIGSYMRLYPGVDGLASNGLRYGAAIELRQNFMGGTSLNAAGVPGGTASSASGNSSAQTVFVRRAFTYLGSDQIGIVRIGTGDGVIGLFDGGIFTSATWDSGVGNFNGGGAQSLGTQVSFGVPFVWLSQAGAEYDNAKVVYLTPQFFGFDFGVQYAPNMGNRFTDSVTASPLQAQTCLVAGPNCIGLSAGADSTRWLNQVAVGARYQGTFGGVDLKGMVVYETAGKETIAGGGLVASGNAASRAAGAGTFKYDNLSFVTAAAAVSFAGFTVAADYIGGALNGQLAMRPSGGAPTNAVVTGVTYANGPWVLGAEVGFVDTQGSANLTKISQRKEFEVAAGGTYKVAPGLALVAEFMHTERHQGGFDFIANGLGTTRDVKGNSFLFGSIVTW